MSGHDLMDAADAEKVDALMRSHYRTEPVSDRSGMLLPSETVSDEATEDEQYAAFMQRHFPGQGG